MTAQRIIQHIFQQPALSQLSTTALEELVTEYPYFTAARLLLAQKNYEQYPSLHSPAVKKAQLYTNNPHYFYQFLTGELEQTAAAPIVPAESQSFSSYTAPVERESEQELPYLLRERDEEWQQEGQKAPAERESEQELSYLLRERDEERQQEGQKAPAERESEQELSYLLRERDEERQEAEQAPEQEASYLREPEAEQPLVAPWEEEDTETTAPPAASFTEETIPAVTKITDLIAPWEEDALAARPETAFTEEVVPPMEEPATAPVMAEKAPWEEEEATTAAGPVAAIPEENRPAAAAEEPGNAEEPIKIFPLEIPEEETTLTFQPLYTDDYFAYKRLKEPEHAEELNEKGMADMRSFTDWLREMKHSFAKKADKDWYHQQLHRIYVDDEPEVSETVEKMAMESITLNDDIVSETLAEIWARQHQYQTAIQIYQKLSLLNPNKSAYFAQKIQELQIQQAETGKN